MALHPSIRIEGGLLGPDVIDQLLSADLPGQRNADFGVESRRSLTDEIAAAFADARALWGVFQRRLERVAADDVATTVKDASRWSKWELDDRAASRLRIRQKMVPAQNSIGSSADVDRRNQCHKKHGKWLSSSMGGATGRQHTRSCSRPCMAAQLVAITQFSPPSIPSDLMLAMRIDFSNRSVLRSIFPSPGTCLLWELPRSAKSER
jgi:hypothetical protein